MPPLWSVCGLIPLSVLKLDPSASVGANNLLWPYQTIHIINPFLLLSPGLPSYTDTHTHTLFWQSSTLLFLGISTSCWKSAFSKALATPIQPQTPPFHFHMPLAPFRVLFSTALSPKNTQVLTNTDNILLHAYWPPTLLQFRMKWPLLFFH